MKKYLITVLNLLILASVSAQSEGVMKKYESQLPQQGRGNVHVAYLGKSIDQMIYEFMEEQGIPGMTLAIVQAPYIPRVVGYGVTDITNKRLASTKTLWPAGPISQGYAAVAIMQLKERGKVELSDKISKYLKNLPVAWQPITILQLLQHSTGIADYATREGFNAKKSPKELLLSVEELPLAFTPGTDVQLSATNFLLLTEVIEAVSKTPYAEFVKKNQIDYLGLKQTYFAQDLGKVKQETLNGDQAKHSLFKREKEYINAAETTVGYRDENGQLVAADATQGALKGFSDIWASAENISHWDIALAGSVLIASPENRDMIYKPTTLANGKVVPAMAGWHFYAHKGLMDIKGNTPGHSSFLSRFTDASELVCVTLMANKEGVDLTNLARRVAAAFDQKLGSGTNENDLFAFESQFSVEQTMQNIKANLKTMGIPVFAEFDHAKNAEQVGLSLRPNQVIVFGSPKVGTKLMQENPSIAVELPLRISVFQDESGSVWVTFPQMNVLASRYGLVGNPIIENMQKMLEQLVIKSASVY